MAKALADGASSGETASGKSIADIATLEKVDKKSRTKTLFIFTIINKLGFYLYREKLT
tara:strand:- start:484 stop:657 length:174 start_codon:yes stop_codon:yes gene_type:complete